ncbi:MAG: glutamate--tRNA ligase [Phycisphaerales bacterium]|nr:MAG: glutamate--tRNA ligase [Phycisphaerales bacterium]
MPTDGPVRVRFAPSPTGYLHIGGARTALFNWLVARGSGGRFVLRIEDTDRKRNVADSLAKILDDLRWLGLNWDEGPEVGGEFGPYMQSERLETYNRHCEQLLKAGEAYYTFETPAELQARREQARKEKRVAIYQRPDPLPTAEDAVRARAEGRPVVVRFKMPDEDITVSDMILGEVTLKREELEDFVIRKSDGWPTYHFACVVDDELMKITHVLRGQEHVMNTPKHIALQRALGFAMPQYAHMPIIMNMDGSKMSKRDKERALAQGEPPPEIDVHDFRAAGYLPEAVVNFIALLGWSPGGDREQMTTEELTDLFSVERINKTAAKFDRDKLLAFNTDWLSRVSAARRLAALRDFCEVTGSPLGQAHDDTLLTLMQASQGIRTFAQLDGKSRFIFVPDEQIRFDEKAVKKVLRKNDGEGLRVLADLLPRLEGLPDWTAEAIEGLLRGVCEETGLGLGKVAQPIRVAVSGGTISPTIFDTLVLLGRERTLTRIRRALEQLS